MANQEHVDLIKTDLASFNQWRLDNRNKILDLTGVDLYRAKLHGAQLYRADLSNARLTGADLTGASLVNTDLSNARLGVAQLNRANLSSANLAGVDLHESTLGGADFSGANLGGADLGGAQLDKTNFTGADLSNARLSGVRLFDTVFAYVNLSDVVNLGTCRHDGPSIIDHRTLERSSRLPDVFSRGCGLSDWQIESSKLFQTSLSSQEINDIGYKVIQLKTDNPISYYSCFISYSHADKTFARRLHDRLQGKGIRCWLDEQEMLPGDDIYEKVDQGIKLWDKVLLCASEDSLTSWWIDNEINKAFKKEQQLMKQRGEKVLSLIPLNLDGYLFSGQWKSGKADEVKTRMAADFTGWENDNDNIEKAFEGVVKALQADDSGRNPPPAPKL